MVKRKKLKFDKKKFKEELDLRHNFKEYWSFIRSYKWTFSLILVFALALSALGVVEKYVFKELIDRGTEFTSGAISSQAFIDILLILILIFFSSLFLMVLFKWISETLLIKMTTSMMADLKRKYFNHIIELSHNFHTTHKTGSLISRLGRGGNALDNMNDVIVFNIAPLVSSLVVVVGSLLFFNITSAIVLFVTVVIFVSYSLYIQNISKPYGAYENKKEDKEKGNVGDFFTNINSVKYFGKEKLVKEKFKKLTEETKEAHANMWTFFKYLSIGQLIILGIGVFFLIYFPMISLLNGDLSVGAIVFIYTIYGTIINALFGFVHGIRTYYRSMIDFHDLFEYGKFENDIKDKQDAANLKIQEGEIEFKGIDFKYGDRQIFKDFNLKIPKDRKVAFVGHSGCGKSTLVNLLYRFYDVNSGQILIDGKNIKNFKQESLRSEMAIVPQEAVLFDDTIYNNVKFSKPNASREEVIKSMKFAQLDKIVDKMPNKENTIVGERGVKLSGGEKQRVSIARAILANKKILVLDEATSALDSETEFEIQKDLQKLMLGRTSIIIAHRLSTIMNADKIVVMSEGKIVQTGTHRQLINQHGEYKKLWNLQKGGYIA
jgi:ATP-binding cassette subfamily B protein